ncbi:NUDIX hydrolase [Candidatus Hodarchaeum mangrovi]
MVTHKLATLAYVIYINPKKALEVLLLYRNKKKDDFHAGKYIGVGGRVEPGETPLECIIRELKEETGYIFTPQNINYRGYIYFDEINRDKFSEDIPAFNWLVFLYTAVVHEKKGFINLEGELKWFYIEDIPYNRMWDGDRYFTPYLLTTNNILEGKFLYNGEKIQNWTFGRN